MDLVAITRFLNGFLMIALPIVLGIYLTNKFQLGWRLWLVGASTFIISQIFHLPFNTYVLNSFLVNLQQAIPGVIGSLVIASLLGLSAGIFEECARYGMYRWWLRDARSWHTGILAGAGAGSLSPSLSRPSPAFGLLVSIATAGSTRQSSSLASRH